MMTAQEIQELLARQRAFFQSGRTLALDFRLAQLAKLYQAVQKYESEINAALLHDLGKSFFEGFMCESGLVLGEISFMRKHLKKFAKPCRVRTPLAQFAAKSFITPEPYGNTLIMSPWNYPILLTLEPLVDAIAAGNTAILKPSAYAPASSEILQKIVSECFSPEYVAVVTGGRAENSALLGQKFDLIFFTGSQNVGREVLRQAAENLTPVILELGGKSPCIVEESADIALAAKRIVFGKFLNCGQTCVAPDYILCQQSIKDELVRELIKQIKLQFGEEPLKNPAYGKIINEKHFSRLLGLIDNEKVIFGGAHDSTTCRIMPTVMDQVTVQDKVMGEEIFGPILPILTYENFDTLINELKNKPKPLALYIFSHDEKHIDRTVRELSYGGGCINDVVIHLASNRLPFGGVGSSGMGSYHGKSGFNAFTHYKSIVDKKTWIDLPMRYQPYQSKFYNKLLHFFLK